MLGLPKRVTAANNLLCVLPKSAEEPQLRKHGVMLSGRSRYFYSEATRRCIMQTAL